MMDVGESPFKEMINTDIDINEPKILDFPEIDSPAIVKIHREEPAKYVHNFIRIG